VRLHETERSVGFLTQTADSQAFLGVQLTHWSFGTQVGSVLGLVTQAPRDWSQTAIWHLEAQL